MRSNIIFSISIFLMAIINIYAQSENYAVFYNKGKELEPNFEESEKNYRTAIEDSSADLKAYFNLSNTYYNEGLYDEAIKKQIKATELANSTYEKHKAFHNLGNSYMKNKMCSEAVLAYKNALRNDPDDDETRYNLAIAKKCEEDQQDKNNDNKEDQQDKNDQQDKKDQQDNDNQDDEDQNSENKSKQKENQKSKLSPQQVKNLLKAIENAEKKVQAKVNDKKQKGPKVISKKDW